MEVALRRYGYVVACFKYGQKKSIIYKDCETEVEVMDAVRKCLMERADLIEVRRYER